VGVSVSVSGRRAKSGNARIELNCTRHAQALSAAPTPKHDQLMP
jgi:hypothetical protein